MSEISLKNNNTAKKLLQWTYPVCHNVVRWYYDSLIIGTIFWCDRVSALPVLARWPIYFLIIISKAFCLHPQPLHCTVHDKKHELEPYINFVQQSWNNLSKSSTTLVDEIGVTENNTKCPIRRKAEMGRGGHVEPFFALWSVHGNRTRPTQKQLCHLILYSIS